MTEMQPHLVAPTATAKTLLAHASWMRALARQLVHDPNNADDVVQQSFLAALERPPRHGANVTGWLRRVVTNRARDAGRGGERRALRERAVALGEALPSTESLVLAAETQRELVGAVLRLEEPYCSTILLRYFWGSSPEQIASDSGVAVSTVRVRTKRGLEALRRDLDARSGGDRSRWMHALTPFVGPGLVAAVSIKAKAIAAMAVVATLLLTVTWFERGRGPDGGAAFEPVAATEDTLVDPLEMTVDDEVASTKPGKRTPVVASQDVSPAAHGVLAGSYIGSVCDPDGSPVAGATVLIYPQDRGNWAEQQPLSVGETGAAGRFELAVPEGLTEDRILLIQAEAEGYTSVSTSPIQPASEISIKLNWTRTVRARVVDEDSLEPIPDVQVSYHETTATTNGDGAFELPGVPVGVSQRLSLVHEDYAVTVAPISVPRHSIEEPTITLRRGALLRARVADGVSGETIAGAEIWQLEANVRIATDDAGRFSMRVAPGDTTSFHITHGNYATFVWYLELEAGEDPPEFTIPMRGLATIEGVLLDDADRPIPDVWLTARPDDLPLFPGRADLDLPGVAKHEVPRGLAKPTDDDGRFTIPVLPDENPFRVRGGSREMVSVNHFPVQATAPGERVWIELRQERGATITGRVERNGAPVRHVRVRLTPADSSPIWARADTDGTFTIEGVPAGRAVVDVTLDTDRTAPVPEPITIDVVAGENHQVDFEWSERFELIEGRVLDATGAPVGGIGVRARRGAAREREFSFSQTGDDGRFQIEVRPGDPYVVSARRGPQSATIDAVAPGARDVELRLDPVGYFTLRIVDARTGSPIAFDHRDSHPIRWSKPGENSFRGRVEFELGSEGLQCVVGSNGTLETIDVEINPTYTGYVRKCVRNVRLSADARGAMPIEVRLDRGLTCVLALGDPAQRKTVEGALVFLLTDDESGDVDGPFPPGNGKSNHRINGIHMWLARPSLVDNLVHFDETGTARIQNLTLGTYVLRVYPKGATVMPRRIELVEDGQVIDVQID